MTTYKGPSCTARPQPKKGDKGQTTGCVRANIKEYRIQPLGIPTPESRESRWGIKEAWVLDYIDLRAFRKKPTVFGGFWIGDGCGHMEVFLYVSVWGCVGFKLENPGVGFCVSLSLSLSLFVRESGEREARGEGKGCWEGDPHPSHRYR